MTLMLQGVLDYCLREGSLVGPLVVTAKHVECLCTAPSDDVALLLGPVIAASIAQPHCKRRPDFPFRAVLFRSLRTANFRVRITGGAHRTFRRTSVRIDDSLGDAAT